MNAFRARSLLVMHNGVRFIRSKAFKPPTKKLEKKLEPTDGQIVPSWSFVKPEKKVKKSEEELLQEMFFGKTSTSPTRLDDDVIPVIPGYVLYSNLLSFNLLLYYLSYGINYF